MGYYMYRVTDDVVELEDGSTANIAVYAYKPVQGLTGKYFNTKTHEKVDGKDVPIFGGLFTGTIYIPEFGDVDPETNAEWHEETGCKAADADLSNKNGWVAMEHADGLIDAEAFLLNHGPAGSFIDDWEQREQRKRVVKAPPGKVIDEEGGEC